MDKGLKVATSDKWVHRSRTLRKNLLLVSPGSNPPTTLPPASLPKLPPFAALRFGLRTEPAPILMRTRQLRSNRNPKPGFG